MMFLLQKLLAQRLNFKRDNVLQFAIFTTKGVFAKVQSYTLINILSRISIKYLAPQITL